MKKFNVWIWYNSVQTTNIVVTGEQVELDPNNESAIIIDGLNSVDFGTMKVDSIEEIV